MKQLTRFLGGALLFLLPLTFTSCDELFGVADNPAQPSNQSSSAQTEEKTDVPQTPTYANDKERPLTFEATQANVKVTLKFKSGAKPDFKKVEYSLDKGATWKALSSADQAILLEKAGDIVMFRGDNPTYNGDAQFVIETATSNARGGTRGSEKSDPVANAIGNIKSLLYGDGFADGKALTAENAGAFKNILNGARIDVQSEDGGMKLVLPEIGEVPVPDAFKGMFEGSTITVAPAIVAQVVGDGTLADTFKDCPNLASVKLDIGGVAEGVTVEQAIGGMLGGTTGIHVKGGLNIEMVPYGTDPSGNTVYQPGTNVNLITLDDVVLTSGMSETVRADASVTVTDPETGKTSEPAKIVLVTEVKLDQHQLELTVNATATLKATVTPENATDQSIAWISNNEKVATVDANGKITAISAGIALIIASHSKCDDRCFVTVKEPATAPEGPTVSKPTGYVEGGDPTAAE